MNRALKLSRRIARRLAAAAVLLAVALPAAAAAAPEGKVNVNTADAATLAFLPRIGPSVAQRIVDHRKKNGPFKSTDDLMLVQGIGEKTYELIKPYVTTSGETSLKEKVRASGKSGKTKKGAKEPKAAKETKASKEATR
jgi:comEA protein